MNKKFSLIAFLLIPLMSFSHVAAQDLPSNVVAKKTIQKNANKKSNISWIIDKMIEDAKQKGFSGYWLIESVLKNAEAEGYQKDQILSAIKKIEDRKRWKKRIIWGTIGTTIILYILIGRIKNWNKKQSDKPPSNQNPTDTNEYYQSNIIVEKVDDQSNDLPDISDNPPTVENLD